MKKLLYSEMLKKDKKGENGKMVINQAKNQELYNKLKRIV